MIRRFVPFAALSLSLVACGDDDHGHEHGEGEHALEEEACEHLANGPFADISANADVDGELENAAVEHTRVDIALVELVSGGYGGYVEFAAETAADFVFFLSDDVPMMVFDSAGNEVEIEATEVGSEECADIAVSHTVELEVGTYSLFFGPNDTEITVGMVHEAAGAEHEHE